MLNWLGRVALLVLSGLATLSIIASMAAVSNIHRSPGPIYADRPPPTATPSPPITETDQPFARVSDAARPAPETSPPDDQAWISVSPERATQEGDVARWMESLTYAVLALAGFLAATMVILLRISASLARIADRSV